VIIISTRALPMAKNFFMIQDLSAKVLIQLEHTYFVALFVTFPYKWLENKHIYEINVTKPKPDAGLLRRTPKRKNVCP
jgi:hypothetical protein